MGQGVSTKNIRPQSYCHYFSNGDQIVSIAIKGVLSFFRKAFVESCQKVFRKTCGMPPFSSD
jgi:hypothetical protein